MAITMRSTTVTKHPALSALGAVTVLLTCLLLIELHAAFTSPAAAPARGAAFGLPVDAASSPADATVAAAQIQSWAGAIDARPLFSPGRRPPGEAAGGQSKGLPRLSGIMVTAHEHIALFSPPNAPPLIVAVGARLGDYTVTAISDDTVTLTGPNGAKTLHTGFGPNSGATVTDFKSKALEGGIDLSQLHIPLPDAAHWNGVPMLGPPGAARAGPAP